MNKIVSREFIEFSINFSSFFKKCRKQVMINGYTASELAELLNIPRYTVENRLSRFGIKPISREAIYPPEAYERLKNVKRGRPKKPVPDAVQDGS
jgi:hypothetical protein